MYRFVIATALFAIACGGSKPETAQPETTGGATGETTDTAAPAPSGWEAKSLDEKKAHMKKVVMPRMAELFKAHDAEEFSDVKCTLCHGEGAMTGDFEMPNEELPKLNPANSFEAHMADHADDVKFMATTVVPEMAKLLGVEPYDPATQKGFGCFSCHTMEGQ